jgi:ATP-dependent DNA helicase RecG
VRLTLPTRTHPEFARFVAQERKDRRELELDDLILLRGVTERGALDRWAAASLLQLPEEEAADRLASLRGRGYLLAQGRGRGTAYRLARHLSDLLRGRALTDGELSLDDEAVRLRVEAILAERERLTNAEVRRISGYSRTQVLRLMQALREEGRVDVRGRGRGAHYVPGPKLRSRTSAGRRRQ